MDAVKFGALPSVTVHVFDYSAGRHTLDVRESGACLMLDSFRP